MFLLLPSDKDQMLVFLKRGWLYEQGNNHSFRYVDVCTWWLELGKVSFKMGVITVPAQGEAEGWTKGQIGGEKGREEIREREREKALREDQRDEARKGAKK